MVREVTALVGIGAVAGDGGTGLEGFDGDADFFGSRWRKGVEIAGEFGLGKGAVVVVRIRDITQLRRYGGC